MAHKKTIVALTLLGGACCWAQAATTKCSALSSEAVSRVRSFVKTKYKLTAEPAMAYEKAQEGDGCFHRVLITGSDGKRAFRAALLMDPTGSYLLSNLMNVTIDPVAAERREEVRLKAIVHDGASLVAGREGAPVEVTVYSDFQCPYCARLWSQSGGELTLPGEDTAVYYRSFPLDNIHPWAHQAAMISKCAELQTKSFSKGLADALFRSQKELTISTVGGTARAYLGGQTGFNMPQYEDCLTSGEGEKRLQADIATGRAAGVAAVPTIFVNGHKYQGVMEPAALHEVIANARVAIEVSGTGAPLPAAGGNAAMAARPATNP